MSHDSEVLAKELQHLGETLERLDDTLEKFANVTVKNEKELAVMKEKQSVANYRIKNLEDRQWKLWSAIGLVVLAGIVKMFM
jgi:hypothetical protein